MKIKKPAFIVATSFAALTLLASCQHDNRPLETVDDCSAVFESRSPLNNKKINKEAQNADEQTITQCKILEVKLDDDTKCEVVGSNKIDNLKAILGEDKDRTIAIVPQKKFKDIAKLANNFLKKNGVNVEKHFDSEVFNNLQFPYRGLKCEIEDRKFVLWSGNKQVIFTLEND